MTQRISIEFFLETTSWKPVDSLTEKVSKRFFYKFNISKANRIVGDFFFFLILKTKTPRKNTKFVFFKFVEN